MERNRKTVRIKDYDYSRAGAYFVTICTQDKAYLFGDVVDGEMILNDAGKIVNEELLRTAQLRKNVEIDVYMVMPNHVHGIIVINHGRGVLPWKDAPTGTFRSPSQTIGAIVRGFKSASTKRINQLRNTPGAHVRQRNYYEHVIRNDGDLNQVREYVAQNPLQWDLDEENPFNT